MEKENLPEEGLTEEVNNNLEQNEENTNNLSSDEEIIEQPRHSSDKIKEKSKKEKPRHQKKDNKKIIIISSLVALLLIGIIAGIVLTKTKPEKPKKEITIKERWGQIYYEYLKDVDNKEENALPENMTDAKINFYDIKDIENPVMTISYEVNDKDYTNIYYINDEKVDAIVYKEPTDIDLLYNIQNKDYNYYTETENNDAKTYKTIKDQIKAKLSDNNEQKIPEYTFKENEKDSVTDVDGKEISITKFDQTFIEIETEDNSIDYNTNLTEKALKKVINKTIDIYKEVEEILTDNIKKSTQTKEEGILKKQEEMKTAKEEVEKKEALEKAKKEAEEKAKREAEEKAKAAAGLKVGNYSLKYGTYNGGDGPSQGETFSLKQNGQCTYNGKACTYTIGTHDFAQDSSSHHVEPCLIIKSDYTFYLYPYSNTEIGDGDINNYIYNG